MRGEFSIALAQVLLFFFLFPWSVWVNETQSAEAFKAHLIVMLVISLSLPGKNAQE